MKQIVNERSRLMRNFGIWILVLIAICASPLNADTISRNVLLERLNALEEELSQIKASQKTALENQENTVKVIKGLKIYVNMHRGGGVAPRPPQNP